MSRRAITSLVACLFISYASHAETEFQKALNRTTQASVCADEIAGSFFSLELLKKLEARHIELVQSYIPHTGEGVRARTFNPMWVFEDSTAMDIVREAFNGEMQLVLLKRVQETERQLVEDETAEPTYTETSLQIDEVVDLWEQEFASAGGEISVEWRQRRPAGGETNRKRFLRRLMLELALMHQEALAENSSGETPTFNLLENDERTALPQYGTIIYLFQTWDSFLGEFHALADQRAHRRVPTVRLPEPARVQTGKAMRQRGIRVVRSAFSPSRIQRDKLTIRNQFVISALEQYAMEGPSAYPLQSLFSRSSNAGQSSGGGQFQWVSDKLGLWLAHSPSQDFDIFMSEFNQGAQELGLPPLRLGNGAQDWYKELVIQIATAHADLYMKEEGVYFQSEDPNEGNSYVDVHDFFFRTSKLTVSRLTRLVEQRLFEARDTYAADLASALENHKKIPKNHFPLLRAMGFQTTSPNPQASFQQFMAISLAKLPQQFEKFMINFNVEAHKLALPGVTLGTGARTWYSEVVLQFATAHARAYLKGVPAFQSIDPSQPLTYLDPTGFYFGQANLTTEEVNAAVEARLLQMKEFEERALHGRGIDA